MSTDTFEIVTREAWIRAYADRVKEIAKWEESDAMLVAIIGADCQCEEYGDWVGHWDEPVQAADDEMDCWDNDGED
jgi:hypothetical protein